MVKWLKLSKRRRLELLRQASTGTGLIEDAIEKDWWVTLALKAVFSTEWKKDLVFKGGTSLSKAWNLIERFSEDIDLVIDRAVFGFPEKPIARLQLLEKKRLTLPIMFSVKL